MTTVCTLLRMKRPLHYISDCIQYLDPDATMPTPRILLAGFCLLAASGCSSGSSENTSPREGLNLARAAWNSTGITTYSFTMLRSCLCTGGTQIARVNVVNGSIASLTDGASGALITAPSDTLFRTFVGLFDLAQDILDRNPDRVTLFWQSEIGHPIDILVNFSFQTVDDDLNIKISEVDLPAGT